jgi:hypothetical protein
MEGQSGGALCLREATQSVGTVSIWVPPKRCGDKDSQEEKSV